MRASLKFCIIASIMFSACNVSERQTAEKASGPPADPGVDYALVAGHLVTRSLGAKPGEPVLIAGTPAEIELLENLAVEVRKMGGWPTITVTSERLTKLLFDAVPPERDADAPVLDLALAKTFPNSIVIEGSGSTAVLRHVAPERIAARARAAEPIITQINKLTSRVVILGNGLFPSEEKARLHDMTLSDFSKLFWAGVNADPASVEATGNAVRGLLRTGKQVQVKSAAGTDLTFSLRGADPYVSDGALSDDDIKRGRAAQTVWLPAGEVYVVVEPGSANGTIVAERLLWEGDVIQGLRLEVRNGRITAMTATSGLDRMKAVFEAATAGKDALTIFDVGVNTAMNVAPASQFVAYMPAGIITLFLGNDTWAGGSNISSFGFPVFLKGATVTVDGTPLVTNGTLQVGRPTA